MRLWRGELRCEIIVLWSDLLSLRMKTFGPSPRSFLEAVPHVSIRRDADWSVPPPRCTSVVPVSLPARQFHVLTQVCWSDAHPSCPAVVDSGRCVLRQPASEACFRSSKHQRPNAMPRHERRGRAPAAIDDSNCAVDVNAFVEKRERKQILSQVAQGFVSARKSRVNFLFLKVCGQPSPKGHHQPPNQPRQIDGTLLGSPAGGQEISTLTYFRLRLSGSEGTATSVAYAVPDTCCPVG